MTVQWIDELSSKYRRDVKQSSCHGLITTKYGQFIGVGVAEESCSSPQKEPFSRHFFDSLFKAINPESPSAQFSIFEASIMRFSEKLMTATLFLTHQFVITKYFAISS